MGVSYTPFVDLAVARSGDLERLLKNILYVSHGEISVDSKTRDP
jgi:hypothetical protein